MSVEKEKPSIEDEAAAAFMQPLQEEWTPAQQEALEARLSSDPEYAKAYGKVEKIWTALDTHAGSPELMRRREEAIAYARQVSGRRWLTPNRHRGSSSPSILDTQSSVLTPKSVAFAASLLFTALLSFWFYTQRGLYETSIAEQRVVELEDRSRITLDAATRLLVRYSADARVIELEEGQAQFAVAQDPARPFKVRAGRQTIVALGTVFTVEYVDQRVRVAMMEGRVAFVPSEAAKPIELSAGEELRVTRDGRGRQVLKADLEAATAWRDGKVIFRSEPLEEAVRRLNRYSRVQIKVVDPALAAEPISGVFEAGNATRFVDALQRSLPISADTSDRDTIRLRAR